MSHTIQYYKIEESIFIMSGYLNYLKCVIRNVSFSLEFPYYTNVWTTLSHCLCNTEMAFIICHYLTTHNEYYLFRNVEGGEVYTYSVSAVLGSQRSLPSPALSYTHGSHYCGDGQVDR